MKLQHKFLDQQLWPFYNICQSLIFIRNAFVSLKYFYADLNNCNFFSSISGFWKKIILLFLSSTCKSLKRRILPSIIIYSYDVSENNSSCCWTSPFINFLNYITISYSIVVIVMMIISVNIRKNLKNQAESAPKKIYKFTCISD